MLLCPATKNPFSYTHPRPHETELYPVCLLLSEKKKKNLNTTTTNSSWRNDKHINTNE
eukprot:NODE_31084_length_404_cov_0.895307.p2 GENE.NODE_31084_length_404_cov_0.895307~~NODE_31084_length_404_cov_0.895307.p2  ORF type:complete len:58 (+),score=1.03 NODE_31084_length_404_cov_0.895307:224-397(+)